MYPDESETNQEANPSSHSQTNSAHSQTNANPLSHTTHSQANVANALSHSRSHEAANEAAHEAANEAAHD